MAGQWTRRTVLKLLPMVVGFAAAPIQSPLASTPGASPAASPEASPAAIPAGANRPVSVTDRVTIELTDSGFRPDYVQATNGTDLHITLRNTGARMHAFQIARLDVDVTVAPGKEQRVTIESPPLGDFTFTSDAEGDEDFEGTLVFYI